MADQLPSPLKPGICFYINDDNHIYTGGDSPSNSSVRVSGCLEIRESDGRGGWWCCPLGQPWYQVRIAEEDILAHTKPA